MREARGPGSRKALAPKWIMPELVVISSPQGARDILDRDDDSVERAVTPMSCELRRLIGDNLLVVPHREWLPRRRALRPVFTKQHVPRLAGHMAEAAEQLARRWVDDAEVDLDAQCRTLTLRALGRSMLGLEDNGRTEEVASAVRIAAEWVADRALRPVNPPRWLPTPRQRRAHSASAALHELAAEILQACRADQIRQAPLVRALMQAGDPQTGESLTDRAICAELVLFMIAGHETTSNALTHALWALGHHREIQELVATEVDQLGDRQLTYESVPRLRYTIQVLHEAMRLRPPVPVVERFLMQDIEADGHRLEAGTHVLVAINAIHRDPTLWDDPLTFDPDRFSTGRSKGRSSWQYLPFGGGPRACIGDQFTMLEATLGLATIIRQTEICSLDKDFPHSAGFTRIGAAPVRARVRQRETRKQGLVRRTGSALRVPSGTSTPAVAPDGRDLPGG
jgi:cytochrome P450